MAEKEERYISITQMVAKENIETEKYRVMPRQEAIERMTVAMCKFDCTDIERECENCNEWEKYDKCESLAEAALNALLEVK
jgi:hypothetical protein